MAQSEAKSESLVVCLSTVSPEAYTDIVNNYDKDADGCVTEDEFAEVFVNKFNFSE